MLSRALPLPLALLILLTPLLGFYRAGENLNDIRSLERQRRAMADAAVANAGRVYAELSRERVRAT